MRKWLTCLLWLLFATPSLAQDVNAAVLRIDYASFLPISRLELTGPDHGFAGGMLATADNNTTGGFLNQTYNTLFVSTAVEDLKATLDTLEGTQIIVVHARATELLEIAQMRPDALILNTAARDTVQRRTECLRNVLHITPSNAMRADAVAQFAALKKWTRVLLVHGSNEADLVLAQAYRDAALKFGIKIVEEREIRDTGGSRRTDTGHVLVQRQIPALLQGAAAHDVVFAADASDVFAPYLPFHLWDPRPVMGSAGLRPVSFNSASESWGATQFQTRFEALANRPVTQADYDVWLALRAVSEAVTRTKKNDAKTLRTYMLSDEFKLAAFKGQPVSFRDWNGQMRQPILLFDGRINASVSPQEGFLHPVSPLDTMGLDRPETSCEAFQ